MELFELLDFARDYKNYNDRNYYSLREFLEVVEEWYTEQTCISCIQSHKVYTFDEYGKVYHVLYIDGVFRLVDDESEEHYESEDIKEFESLLIGVVYA